MQKNVHTSNKLAEPPIHVCVFVYVNCELWQYGVLSSATCMWLLNMRQVVNTHAWYTNHRCRFNQPVVRLKNKSWRSIPVWLHSLIIVWSSNFEMTEWDGPSGCCECNYILTINRPGPQRRVCYMMTYLTVFSSPGKPLNYDIITRENMIYKNDNYFQVQ